MESGPLVRAIVFPKLLTKHLLRAMKRHAAIEPGTDRHEHDQANREIHKKLLRRDTQLNAPTGCSNRMASKAAASEDPTRTFLCTLGSEECETDAGRLFQHPQVIAYAMGSTTPTFANPSRRITQLSHRPQA